MRADNDNNPTGASIRFRVEPRLAPTSKAARRLHLTTAEFERTRGALRALGFPAPCPVTGHYDLKAIDLWLDRQAGIADIAVPIPANDAAQLVSERLAALG